MIQNALHFFECQVEARTGIGKAERTLHVTGAIHLNDAQAGVLLMLRTETAVVRTPLLDVGGVGQGDGARLVEACCGGIGLSITIDQSFKQTMLRTTLAHIHFIVTQEDMRIDDAAALRANAAGQLIEDVVSIFFLAWVRRYRRCCRGSGCRDGRCR